MAQSVASGGRGTERRLSRRTLVRSGTATVAGGVLSRAGIREGTAQLASLWSAQRYDPSNTGHAPTTEPLRGNPGVEGRADIAAGVAGAGFLVDGETAYVHGVNGGLAAVNATTDEADWRLDIGAETIVPEFLNGGRLVGRATDGTVYTLDAATGDIDAELAVGFGRGLGWDGGDGWFATTTDGLVVAGRIGRSEPRWETAIDGIGFRPAVDGAARRVYVTTAAAERVDRRNPETLEASGTLYALDTTDGSVLWEDSRQRAGVCEPVVTDATVYWAGADGDIRAYDAETGDVRWEQTTDARFFRTPAVAGETLLAGTEAGQLVGVDAATGDEIGRFGVEGAVTSVPVAVGSVVYVGTSDETVYAFDYEAGEQLWSFDARDPVNSLTPTSGGVIVETDVGYTVLTSLGTDAPEAPDVSRRGLFSNGGDRTGPAADPVNLTTLGFLLSIAGIGYQMLQGR